MLLCSSKIPVKEVCTKEAFVALAINWVTKSRNYGFPFFTWDGQSEILRKSSNGATFQVVLFEDGVICAVRLCSVDGRLAQWTADFILDTENKILAFQLYREALPDVAHIRREFSLPVLVQDVIAADFARKDEKLDITDKPHLLHTEDASWVADIILRKQIYSLPIVYISCEYEGHCVVNPYMLAEKLNGVAHVLYETTRELSFSLKSLTDGKNPYAGAIEIFYPNGKRRILPRQLEGSHSKKVYSIVNTVIEHMAQLHIDSRYSLTQLQSNKLQMQLKNVVRKGEADSAEYKELEAMYEELLKQKQDQIGELKGQLESALDSVRKLENQLEYQGYQLESIDGIPILSYGTERDLYPNEQQSLLIEIIEKEKERSRRPSRRYDILKSVIEENDKNQNGIDEKRRALKKCLHGYTRMTPAIKKELQEIGFTVIDDGKHIKLIFMDDDRYIGTLSKTGSDHRGGDNTAHDMISQIF